MKYGRQGEGLVVAVVVVFVVVAALVTNIIVALVDVGLEVVVMPVAMFVLAVARCHSGCRCSSNRDGNDYSALAHCCCDCRFPLAYCYRLLLLPIAIFYCRLPLFISIA